MIYEIWGGRALAWHTMTRHVDGDGGWRMEDVVRVSCIAFRVMML